MLLFSGNPGKVFRYEDPITQMLVAVEGFGRPLNCCLTAIGVAGRANAKITHAFKKMTYVYSMGERSGDLQVSGVTFPGQCGPANVGKPSGLESVMTYYYDQFGLNKRGKPVRVTLGRRVLEGFLLGFRIDSNDPQTGIGAFSLVFNFFPNTRILPEPKN